MGSHSKIKYFIVITLALLLLVFIYTFLYIKTQNKKSNTVLTQTTDREPYQTLTPTNNATNTQVSLYKNAPPDFPKEILPQNITINSSGKVSDPSGKTQITVSYISDKNITDLVDSYNSSLPKNGWNILLKSIVTSTNVATIKATKENQSIQIIVTPLKNQEMIITFQYQKL